MNATPVTPTSGIDRHVCASDISDLMSTVSRQMELITEFQVEMVKSLQVLHREQQHLVALIADIAPAQPDALAAPPPAAVVKKTIEFICVGLSDDDPHFQMLRQNAAETVNLRTAGMHDALAITKGRPTGSEAILQLFNVAAMVQDAPDPERALAICDRIFHGVRLADRLGAKVTWTANDLPRNDKPHGRIAHELYQHMGNLPLDVILPSSDDLLGHIRLSYPQIAMKAGQGLARS